MTRTLALPSCSSCHRDIKPHRSRRRPPSDLCSDCTTRMMMILTLGIDDGPNGSWTTTLRGGLINYFQPTHGAVATADRLLPRKARA